MFPVAGGESKELLRVQKPESLVGNIILSWTLNSSALVVTKRLNSGQENPGDPRDLWLVPISAGAPRKLNIDAGSWDILNPIGAQFSPDGRYVAFMAGKRAAEVWALEVPRPAMNASR